MKVLAFLQNKTARLVRNVYFGYFLEMLPFIFLASFMAAPYLDFRPDYYPVGYEYHLVTVSHYAWDYLFECGSCMLWNGTTNGGMPAFAELHGAILHPFVIITTLIWGVINGTKVLLFLCLLVSGISMWWFAKELEVSRLSRIWISLFGVVGGHIIGRLEAGNIILVLSTSFACLLFPMVLRLNKNPTPGRVAGLALIMALTWLSGQGYIQLGVLLGWFPAFLWILFEKGKKQQQKWLAFGGALIISLLICAILLLPALHFSGSTEKYTMDDFKNLQPLRYVPLNFVINDHELFRQQYLGMDTFPYARINFIGWLPVILSVIAGYFVMQKKEKQVYFAIYASIFLVLIAASRDIYPVLKDYLPFVNRLRAFSVATSLMVPPLLAMAAWGLDRIFELKWPRMVFHDGDDNPNPVSFSLKWLILIPLMILAFKQLIPFSKSYINLIKVEVPQSDLNFVRLDDTQWVNPASDEWFPVLMSEKRKLILGDRSFMMKDRPRLYGYIDLLFNPNNDPVEHLISRQPNFDVIMRPEEIYASVDVDGKIIPCKAVSRGGEIDVWCDTPAEGTLIVREYMWDGWVVWTDGDILELEGGDWLSVAAPAGKHVYSFRYHPWDVYAGAGLSLIGILAAVVLLFIKEKPDVVRDQE